MPVMSEVCAWKYGFTGTIFRIIPVTSFRPLYVGCCPAGLPPDPASMKVVSFLKKMVMLGKLGERRADIFTSYKLSCLETSENGPKRHTRRRR